MTLLDVVLGAEGQPDLFEMMSVMIAYRPLMDGINRRFDQSKIGFGKVPEDISKFTGRAAFQRVLENWDF